MKKTSILFITVISFLFLNANEIKSFDGIKSASLIPVSKLHFPRINQKKKSLISNTFIKDTIAPFKLGTIELSDEFKSFLHIGRNSSVNVFKFEAPYKGNIILNGFVSAGTYGKMLYSRLIKNGEIISEKTCGIGSPLYNGPFNFQTFVNKGDKLSIQILVQDHKWQLHCCPDLYSCTYILIKK
jgi:hypothetical protein